MTAFDQHPAKNITARYQQSGLSNCESGLTEELHGKQSAKLKQQMLELFDQPSKQFVDAVNNLAFDLTDVVDLPVKDFLFTQVTPTLLRDESIQSELFRIARRGIDTEDDTVGELLGLDQDARDNETICEFVTRARNAVLSDIVSLEDDTRLRLSGIPEQRIGNRHVQRNPNTTSARRGQRLKMKQNMT